MKRNLLYRIVAVLLVPCLIGDPSSAVAFQHPLSTRGREDIRAHSRLFETEAITPFLVWVAPSALYRRLTGKVRNETSGGRASKESQPNVSDKSFGNLSLVGALVLKETRGIGWSDRRAELIAGFLEITLFGGLFVTFVTLGLRLGITGAPSLVLAILLEGNIVGIYDWLSLMMRTSSSKGTRTTTIIPFATSFLSMLGLFILGVWRATTERHFHSIFHFIRRGTFLWAIDHNWLNDFLTVLTILALCYLVMSCFGNILLAGDQIKSPTEKESTSKSDPVELKQIFRIFIFLSAFYFIMNELSSKGNPAGLPSYIQGATYDPKDKWWILAGAILSWLIAPVLEPFLRVKITETPHDSEEVPTPPSAVPQITTDELLGQIERQLQGKFGDVSTESYPRGLAEASPGSSDSYEFRINLIQSLSHGLLVRRVGDVICVRQDLVRALDLQTHAATGGRTVIFAIQNVVDGGTPTKSTNSMIHTMDSIRDIIRQAPAFVDVGAHTGILGCLAGKLGNRNILFVERMESAHEIIRENADFNGIKPQVRLSVEEIPAGQWTNSVVAVNISDGFSLEVVKDILSRGRPSALLITGTSDGYEEALSSIGQRGWHYRAIKVPTVADGIGDPVYITLIALSDDNAAPVAQTLVLPEETRPLEHDTPAPRAPATIIVTPPGSRSVSQSLLVAPSRVPPVDKFLRILLPNNLMERIGGQRFSREQFAYRILDYAMKNGGPLRNVISSRGHTLMRGYRLVKDGQILEPGFVQFVQLDAGHTWEIQVPNASAQTRNPISSQTQTELRGEAKGAAVIPPAARAAPEHPAGMLPGTSISEKYQQTLREGRTEDARWIATEEIPPYEAALVIEEILKELAEKARYWLDEATDMGPCDTASNVVTEVVNTLFLKHVDQHGILLGFVGKEPIPVQITKFALDRVRQLFESWMYPFEGPLTEYFEGKLDRDSLAEALRKKISETTPKHAKHNGLVFDGTIELPMAMMLPAPAEQGNAANPNLDRTAGVLDAPAISHLEVTAFLPRVDRRLNPVPVSEIVRYIEDSDYAVFVAQAGEVIVGYLITRYNHVVDWGIMLEMTVLPEFENRHIGARLSAAGIRWIAAQGPFTSIYWHDSGLEEGRSGHLAEKLGFKRIIGKIYLLDSEGFHLPPDPNDVEASTSRSNFSSQESGQMTSAKTAAPPNKAGQAHMSFMAGESLYPKRNPFTRPDPERRILERILGPLVEDSNRSSGDPLAKKPADAGPAAPAPETLQHQLQMVAANLLHVQSSAVEIVHDPRFLELKVMNKAQATLYYSLFTSGDAMVGLLTNLYQTPINRVLVSGVIDILSFRGRGLFLLLAAYAVLVFDVDAIMDAGLLPDGRKLLYSLRRRGVLHDIRGDFGTMSGRVKKAEALKMLTWPAASAPTERPDLTGRAA